MKPTRGTTPAKRPPGGGSRDRLNRLNSSTDAEQVSVYCRLRPPSDENELSCAEVEGDNVVVLVPPKNSRAYRGGRDAKRCTFTKAFGEEATQKEVFHDVGMPMVEHVVSTKGNALLFMYGVTGSGKTHTMEGRPDDAGLMARSFDVVFNSIGHRQVPEKRMIVPDGSNGFKVQCIAQAMVDRQQEMINNRHQPRRREPNLVDKVKLAGRLADESVVTKDVDHNAVYAVFMSYVEVYNERIFDLLETDIRDVNRTKALRTDSTDLTYVHDVTEVQVQSAKEALENFYKGQARRRIANTTLNNQSSRSHSILNIRLVKAYPGADGEIDQDAPHEVSQLSLVDMAGSERANRTGNTGDKLAESSNINKSLTVLRQCIQKLRENQRNGQKNPVPYRESKITHMFGSFFDGKGNATVKMMVCVNPRAADFDENLNVMEFAEDTQTVTIEPKIVVPPPTPGRRLGQDAYREALRRVNEVSAGIPSTPYSPIYSLGPDWPSLDIDPFDENEDGLDKLAKFLEKRVTTRNTLIEDHQKQAELFRARLVDAEQELIIYREENTKLKSGNDGERRRIRDLETRLVNAEAANTSLKEKLAAYDSAKTVLERELDEKELMLNEQKRKMRSQKKEDQKKVQHHKAINSELALRLREEAERKAKLKQDQEKLKQVTKIIAGKHLNKTISDPDMTSSSSGSSDNRTPWKRKPLSSAKSNPDMTPKPTPRRSVAVSNPRYRRSRSTGSELWVDHQTTPGVQLNTIMQPSNIKPRRSVTRLSRKDLKDSKAAHYALTTQEQDSDGDLETKIYKGDIIPTSGGGQQVVFNDVEILKQKSPEKSPDRVQTRRSKRSYEETLASVGSRIADLERKLGGSPKKYKKH